MFKGFLKVSTAKEVVVGPLTAYNSDVTPVTDATLSGADDAVISKAAGDAVSISGATFTAKTDMDGFYDLSLTAAYTDTLGELTLALRDNDKFKPVMHTWFVLPEQIYNSLFAGSDLLQVDATQIDGHATSAIVTGADNDMLRTDVIAIDGETGSAENLAAAALGIEVVTVGTGSTVTSIKTTATEATNDHYNGRTALFISGALKGQAASISDYDGSTKSFTVSALTEAPTSGNKFVVV